MHIGKHALNKSPGILLLVATAPLLVAQHGGFLSGQVRDRSGLPVPGAEVRIQSQSTGARQQTICDAQGHYISSELAAGDYNVTVRSSSFRTVSRTGIVVKAGETQITDVVIELLPLIQEVTVESARDESDPTANGLAVTRGSSLTTLPMNGRDLHALYSLTPGAAVTPAASSDGGQFTVAGQRPNTNTFRIDGVSGNTGLGLSAMPGTFTGATLPGMTVIGSTQSLVSKEEIQRVDMRSSDFAPEYASRPGASVLVETRSGSNDFHGSAFVYARPQLLDSTDWFASKYDVPLAPAALNGYGGSLGGALWPDRTFFFAAFEQVNVNDTALEIMPSPSLSARQSAPANYAALLNVFPSPLGPALNTNEGIAAVPLSKNANVDNYSVRLDQAFNEKVHLFARLADVPSSSTTVQLDTTEARFAWKSATVGATIEWAGLIHEFRFNYSFVHATSSWPATTEAQASALNLFNQGAYYDTNYVTAISIAGLGQVIAGHGDDSLQRQYEGAYTAAKQLGRHDLRAGLDFIELLPRTLDEAYGVPTLSVVSQNVAAMVAGNPLDVTFSGGKNAGASGHIPIGSLFVQDTYKFSDRLTLLYGLRWEITHPSDSAYNTGFSVGQWNGPGNPIDTPLSIGDINSHLKWPMRYGQVAPRFGLAYHWTRPNVVLRLGAGLFYDDALGSLIDPVNLSPLSWSFIPGELGTSSLGQSSGVAPLVPTLFLPKVWEWRVSAEKAVGSKSTASLSYVGSTARKLLREQTLLAPGDQTLEGFAFSSTGSSDFEALEAQYRGQITSGFGVLAAYTWGHSIDTGSQDSAIFWTGPGYSDDANRGSSSFDLRQNLTASATYTLPNSYAHASRWWGGWSFSSTLTARTGFPFDVTTIDRSIGLGFANAGRPNLVYGVPLWISNDAVPGGRELNPAAFQISGQTNGTLGRDVLTGFGAFQVDASVRRQFRLYGSSVLEVSASAYNVFNRSSFSNPIGYLGSPLFGQSVSMQSLMLGSGGPNSGLTPIFQQGGPRTVELGVKFSF